MTIERKPSILIIYTGGTTGMMKDEKTGVLKPFTIENIIAFIPELKRFDYHIGTHSFNPPIDSSNMKPGNWLELAKLIGENYEDYDGFVILHGSDTMAFTASALSFLLEDMEKPVILTGSQLPISTIRTDARENLVTSIEIAAAKRNGKPIIPEVCIFFEDQLYRGNRTHKYNAENFDAFLSVNYPVLANAGVRIRYNNAAIKKPEGKKLKVHQKLDKNIASIRLFPGLSNEVVKNILQTKNLKALILETFGTGNAPTDVAFLEIIRGAVENGIIIYNVTQCRGGNVDQTKYETSAALQKAGVTGGSDITFEAAVTKLMYLLGKNMELRLVKELLKVSLRGEMSG